MASIEQRGSRFRVTIRKKGITINKTFSSAESAELFAKYKEDLIDEIEAFDPPLKDMITLHQAIDLKLDIMRKELRDARSISDIEYIKNWFSEFLDKSVSELSYEVLMAKALEMLNGTVFRGGNIMNGKGHDREKIQSSKHCIKQFNLSGCANRKQCLKDWTIFE
jgi:DNA repair protein RadC